MHLGRPQPHASGLAAARVEASEQQTKGQKQEYNFEVIGRRTGAVAAAKESVDTQELPLSYGIVPREQPVNDSMVPNQSVQ